MVPRDTYKTIPAARSFADIPFDRWRELGADGLVTGSVERTGPGTFRVEVRLFDVRTRRSVMAKEYTRVDGQPAALRAHGRRRHPPAAARAARGRADEADVLVGPRRRARGQRDRGARREGDLHRRLRRRQPAARDGDAEAEHHPAWSPDARSIAYTSYRRDFPDIFISLIYQGTLENPTGGRGQNWLPAWSPDGTRLCFTSTRDGNSGAVRDEPRRLERASA